MSQKLVGSCVVGQSGGPTAVINSSVYGVVKAALAAPEITHVYGASYGITGILNDRLYVLDQEDEAELELLMNTPSSELGSCRYKMKNPEEDDSDYRRILEIFKKYDIRYFFYIGGNDSMDTCMKVSKYFANSSWECRVIGVPKTIDNDLRITDHCPGYGSAIKYIANSVAEVKKDTLAYTMDTITVVEIMGRDAGWLTAGSALAGLIGCGPDLIYLPEVIFDEDAFIEDVKAVLAKTHNCFIAASEGLKYPDGSLVAATAGSRHDGFGHVQLGGLGAVLGAIAQKATGAKMRSIELSLLQRCAAHVASGVDVEEAVSVGEAAVTAAVAGVSDKMIGIACKRENGSYSYETILVPLDEVANRTKTFPRQWINEKGNGLTQDYIDYAAPLISGIWNSSAENGLPRYAHLKKIIAK